MKRRSRGVKVKEGGEVGERVDDRGERKKRRRETTD